MIPEPLNTDQIVSLKSKEFDAVISLAQTALKSSILINGGAAIAILALMGNTWSENSITADLAESLLFFSIGVLLAVISSGAAYLSQILFLRVFGEEDKTTEGRGKKLQLISIILVIVSYILFTFGALEARSAFSDLEKPQSTSCTCGEAAAVSS